MGGDANSLSFALFFLTCGLTVMLADISRAAPADMLRRIAAAVLIAIILPLAISEAPLALDIPAGIQRLATAPQQVALQYLQRHPGQAYFPWLPQSHWYAEHQFRHYGYGIADRLMAGEQLTENQFRAYIPPNPRIVAFAADGTPRTFGYDLMSYLPAYRFAVNDPELPGWQVFAAEPAIIKP